MEIAQINYGVLQFAPHPGIMTGTHLHLLVNHVPIIGALFALTLLVASMWYGRDVLQRTALVLLVVVGAAAGVSKLSGDPAEDGVRGKPGVTRASIHEHEEMADKAFLAAVALGLFSVVALIRWRNVPLPANATRTALGGAIVVSGLMAYTGLLGGQIRHTEVRPGATDADAVLIEPPRARRPDTTQTSR